MKENNLIGLHEDGIDKISNFFWRTIMILPISTRKKIIS